MKRTVVKSTVIICLLFSFFKARAQQIFQKSYFTDTTYYSQGNSFLKLDDKGYMVAGTTMTTSNSNGTYILRLDSMGEIIWSKVYKTPWSDNTIYLDRMSDSNFVLTGYQFFYTNNGRYFTPSSLIKFSTTGNIIWAKSLIDTIQTVQFFFTKTVCKNNFIYAMGHSVIFDTINNSYIDSSYRAILSKFDANGQLIWTRKYGSIRTEVHDFISTPDSGFLMVGGTQTYDWVSPSANILFFKVDSSGIPLWAFQYDSVAENEAKVIIDNGDGFLIGGIKYIIGTLCKTPMSC